MALLRRTSCHSLGEATSPAPPSNSPSQTSPWVHVLTGSRLAQASRPTQHRPAAARGRINLVVLCISPPAQSDALQSRFTGIGLLSYCSAALKHVKARGEL